jgi:serine/threonine-protein kinase
MRHASAAERWSAVKALFWLASEATPDERERLLAERTDDERVRAEVRRLLQAAGEVGDRFELPAIAALGSALAAASPLPEVDATHLVGQRVGPYDVVRRVGEGRSGTVYEAIRADDAYRQRVAVKTIWRVADGETLDARIRAERRTLGALRHPNLARLLDGGRTADGLPYLVTEFVDGEPIDAWCDARRLPLRDRLALFAQLCGAVQYAHRHLTLHRDLKPSNVVVTREGEVKLLDLGLAALLDDDAAQGAPGFVAPEQRRPGPVSTAVDVYALGALLHLLLTGRVPGEDQPQPPPSALATTDAARARGLRSTGRLARALRGELDAVVLAAMRRDPEHRYATADALGEDVRRFLADEPVHANERTLGERLRDLVRRTGERPLP